VHRSTALRILTDPKTLKNKPAPRKILDKTANLETKLALSIPETARLLSVSETNVRRLITRGHLKPLRLLRHILIPAEQLINLAGDKTIFVATRDQRMQDDPLEDRQPVLHPDKDALDKVPFLPGTSPVELKAIKSLPSDGTRSAVAATNKTTIGHKPGHQHSIAHE